MRKIDEKAWEERLAYIETLKHKDMLNRVKTLKDVYQEYGVTPEEEEAFKVKADDIQIGGTHYKEMGVEPWTVMQAILSHEEFVGYLKGSVLKYALRQGHKDSPDADKCKHYIQKLKEVQRES